MSNNILYEKLETSDLKVDAIYESRDNKFVLSKLMQVGTQGGIRKRVCKVNDNVAYCILSSTLAEADWPDRLDEISGQLIYYGDNRTAGKELHDTRQKGNELLRESFEYLHLGNRSPIPPFFFFSKGTRGRNQIFRGLAAPGYPGLIQTEDLVAIWKSNSGLRFQNYRAIFTILDVPVIKREWLSDLLNGEPLSNNAPDVWRRFIEKGEYTPLQAVRSKVWRSKEEQLPNVPAKMKILERIIAYFKTHKDREYAFEDCAATLLQLMDTNFTRVDLTRPWRDGGRDATGVYQVGHVGSKLDIVFAMEAKCYGIGNGAGVKQTSRLLARIRHRQFGVFITTSYIGRQAYKELIEDDQPLVVISGTDIVDILFKSGINSTSKIDDWLKNNF